MSQPKADARVPGIWTIGLASSAGTVIEWYDFYLYGSLAVFFRTLFYPPNGARSAERIRCLPRLFFRSFEHGGRLSK